MTEEQAKYKIEGRPSTIFRTVKNKDNPYVMIDRRPIDNPRLSFKAKGILTYLLSRPDGWEVNLVDLTNRSLDGLASVRAGAKELRDTGHLKHTTVFDEVSGKVVTHLWEVYETPDDGNRTLDAPQVGVDDQENYENQNAKNQRVDKPACGKSHASSIKYLSSNELNNSEPENEKIKKPPQFLYWDTLMDDIKNDPNLPRTSRKEIALGHPVKWLGGSEKVLVIEHPEPEWAKQRWSRLLSNLMQGLCPGSRVEFVKPGSNESP